MLTRKMEISWARGSGPWPSRAVRVCGGRYESGGLAVARSARLGFGFGDAVEGDFEAEGAELADVVGDLPAGALALVVVRAEVLIARAGAGQQPVVDLQLGVAEGDLGLGFPAAAARRPSSLSAGPCL